MTKKEKEQFALLKSAFEDTIWMAIRYADGRHTYAPGMVRDAIENFQKVYPEWKPRHDITIEAPDESKLGGMNFREDYLYDLFQQD